MIAMTRTFLTVCLTALITLALVETVLKAPYLQAKSWVKTTLQPDQTANDLTDFANICDIPSTTTLLPGSVAIIGHAYGRPGRSSGFLGSNVEKFIRDHASHLSHVIFSGDVLAEPSVAQWARLTHLSDQLGVSFHIAPGNHDVGHGDNARRDIWKNTRFGATSALEQPLEVAGFTILLEDSIVTNWQMASSVIARLQNAQSTTPIILIRHNIAVKEMEILANSQAGQSADPLPDLNTLSKRLPSGTTIISGDSGAFQQQPRLACAERNNVTFVANGIGELDGDVVLILSAGNLYQMAI